MTFNDKNILETKTMSFLLKTPIFIFSEISSDIPVIVLLALACVLTIVIIGIFLEEHVYLQKVHDNDPIRQRRVITLLGLYPVSVFGPNHMTQHLLSHYRATKAQASP